MQPIGWTIFGMPMRRMARLAAIVVSIAVALTLAIFFINDQMDQPGFWRVALALLLMMEAAYFAAIAFLVFGIPVLAVLVARGRGKRRLAVGRCLLASLSLIAGLLAAEAVAAVWIRHAGRSTVVPVGGIGRKIRIDRAQMWPPVSLEDVALPTRFEDPPGDTTVDIVVVGESSAEGVPFNSWLSIGRLVEWKLKEVMPGRRVNVQILAISGSILEHQHRKLADLRRRPDLLIVYCGHNEFSSRLNGARDLPYYVDDREPSGWQMVCEEAESISPLCELLRRTKEKCLLEIPPLRGGNRELVDRPAYTAAEFTLLLADFRHRLEVIAAWGERIGATMILIPPPGNDAGFEPNRSFLPASTTRDQREAFRREFLVARDLEQANAGAAIAAYRALIKREPGFAEAHYRLGVLLDAAGDAEESYRQFVAARDNDGYPMRCLVAFQDVYRDVAAKHGAILVDAQAEFHAVGNRGRLDDEMFQDAMHPSLRGQITLAQAAVRELKAHQAFGWPEGAPAPTIDPKACVEHFRIGPDGWKKVCLWGVHFGNFCEWLRYDPTPRRDRRLIYARAYDRLVAGEPVEAVHLPNLGIPRSVPVTVGTSTVSGSSTETAPPKDTTLPNPKRSAHR